MFNLLVSYGGWDDHAGTIANGRVYIRPAEEPGCRVVTDGRLDVAKVVALPALLMSETTGRDPCVARVGRITDIHQDTRETRFEYVIDARFPVMSSHDFNDYATQLGTSKGSLTHTHWEICSGDLFKVICLMQQQNVALAKPPPAMVFSTAGIAEQNDKLVSVMMPFGAEFTPVYTALQQAAVGFECKRADDIWIHPHVIQDIVDLITKAKVVICDCTGKNPNVFYEIGIAHSLGKNVILITQSKDDIPFDLRHLRYLEYVKNREGLKDLAKALQDRLKSLAG